jgi:peptidoglycan/xylan/chitin deacetylase (PgdA/CDA1 family)
MLENHLGLKARLRYFLERVTDYRIGWHSPEDNSGPLLTFDDGPLVNTWSILEILEQFGLKATFFMVGHRMLQYPEIVRAAASAGHCVANHGYQHVIMKQLPLIEFQRQVCASFAIIHRLAGKQPRLFRPPKGQINPLQVAWLLSQRIRLVFWSHQLEAISRTIIEPVPFLGMATPVILLHDCDDVDDIKSVLKIFY